MATKASFACSSIGKKHLMAVSGLAWCGFVLMHMLGNLLLLVGPDSYNSYSYKLTSNPFLLIAEGGLVVTLLLHVFSAAKVTLENREAKPEKYAVAPVGKGNASVSSRTMALSGTLILVFIVLHLITFKFGPEYPVSMGDIEVRDLYRLVKEAFSSGLFFGWYLLCMVVLFMHLKHALFSSLQTLGLVAPAHEKKLRCASAIFGVVVSAGFMLAPVVFFFRG